MYRFILNSHSKLLGFVLIMLTTTAVAEETICNSSLGVTMVDNLLVPSNASCSLDSTRVLGSVKIENNATLVAQKIVVIGNIQADNSQQINILDNSRIGGSVQLKQGGGSVISDSIIDGDIQFESNASPFKALRNQVGGSVQVFQNTASIEIQQNKIKGNLQCKENTPAPTGGGNVVGGNKEDQCSQLTGVVVEKDGCVRTSSLVDDNLRLHIPRVTVINQDGNVSEYWASLRFAPELSQNGNIVFELDNPSQNLGLCN